MTEKVIPIRYGRGATSPDAPWDGAPLSDTLSRPLRDLRISVTDRCNFRCVYCMPREVFNSDYAFLPHAAILTFEEIARVAGVLVGMGVKKIRLTGGEPLIRKDLHKLVALLAPLGTDLTLTTNGSALARQARRLKDAGLQRVTVSLDALDDDTFHRINDADVSVARVIGGIEAAAAAGLAPVKINMVVKRGMNDHQIVDMARRWRGSGHILRFIEFMDVGSTNGWRMDDVVPSAEVVRRIGEQFPLEPADPNYTGEVAERWRYLDGGGEIGVISSVTQAFCSDCSRIRLSTEGSLFTCLFATSGHDLKSLIRGGAGDGALRDRIASVWNRRADRYSEIRTAETARLRKVEMSYIGG
ncbi:MAG: cyclic pyranopterin phosphate synthase [Betaproteobacteria bacterium RIFCSPLOWO2_02_FULL_66_14]|nr:MAG: cyclic pyranopterin phosphate synthase [Betaproteobacteria bacterium RIFCSPLOWO2_02_FULL_66_14]